MLLLPDQHIESTIDLWLYFTPDLPLDLVRPPISPLHLPYISPRSPLDLPISPLHLPQVLEDRSGKGHTGRALDTDYEQRLRAWYEGLPESVRRPIEDAQRHEVLMEQGAPPDLDRKAHPNRSPRPNPRPNPDPRPNQAYSPTSTGRHSSRRRTRLGLGLTLTLTLTLTNTLTLTLTRTRTCTSSASSSRPCSRRAS